MIQSIYEFFKKVFDPFGELLIGNYLDAASSYATDIDSLIGLVAVVAGFWFVLAELMFFYLIFRFRKKDGQRSQYVTGEEKHLKRWITWPHGLIIICDVLIVFMAIKVWYDIKQDLPEAQQTVRVVAQQWAWAFAHPGPDGRLDTADDIVMSDELHVQVDTLYHYELESLDVLHDFSVPVFRLKHDAIPGRVITGWFKPTKTGEYDIQCAEMCGIGHGIMGARIFIETPEEHAAWMTEHSPSTRLAKAVP